MHRYFSLTLPFAIFARNVAFVSLAGVLPLLVVYVALQPGFAAMLAGGGPALSRFLRQVATNGFPVVFVVNYAGFFLFALQAQGQPDRRHWLTAVAVDMAARVSLFIALHAIIYVASADWFGSFGGGRATALQVVGPTLARSALFENISGVYLYACLLGALPIYACVIAGQRDLPVRAGPWLAALACCALLAGLLTAVASAIVSVQPV